jgi:hypothetical protein
MLQEMLPLVIALGLLVITGHGANDLLATWKGGVPYKELKAALQEFVEQLPVEALDALAKKTPETKDIGDDAIK